MICNSFEIWTNATSFIQVWNYMIQLSTRLFVQLVYWGILDFGTTFLAVCYAFVQCYLVSFSVHNPLFPTLLFLCGD